MNCYFVTIVLNNRAILFIEDIYHCLIYDSLLFYANKYNSLIYIYVTMPDHIHFIIRPQPPGCGCFKDSKNHVSPGGSIYIINKMIKEFKSYTGKNISKIILLTDNEKIQYFLKKKYGQRNNFLRIWQRGFYLKKIYSKRDLLKIFNYIKNNPKKLNIDNRYLVINKNI